jgi:hypothetical protein
MLAVLPFPLLPVRCWFDAGLLLVWYWFDTGLILV